MFVPQSFVSKLLFLSKLCKETCIISCSVATKSRQSLQLSSWFIYNWDLCKIIFLIWKFRRNWHSVTLGGSLGQQSYCSLTVLHSTLHHNCKLPHCPHHSPVSHCLPLVKLGNQQLPILSSIMYNGPFTLIFIPRKNIFLFND